MSSAQPDLDALHAGTSFSTPAERELAARESLTRARALRLRIESQTLPKTPRRQTPATPPPATARKTNDANHVMHATADQILDAVDPLLIDNPLHIKITKVTKNRGDHVTFYDGVAESPDDPWKLRAIVTTHELKELKRWLTNARRHDHKVLTRIRKLAGRAQAEQVLKLRDQRLALCKHLLDLYEVAPTQRACLIDVARVIRASDLPLTEGTTRPFVLASRDTGKQLRQQNTLLQGLADAADAATGPSDARLTSLVEAFIGACTSGTTGTTKRLEHRSPFIKAQGLIDTGVEIDYGPIAAAPRAKDEFYKGANVNEALETNVIDKGILYDKGTGTTPTSDRNHRVT